MTTPGFTMKTVVFVGSARNSAPFWGGPARLGTRVVKFVENALKTREVKHEITILDPVELQLEVLEKPQYFYAPGTAPEKLNKIAQLINDADAILVVTPEYNHSAPPALTNLFAHFPPTGYANKPSGIVTYSYGQFGGQRAAMALRPILAELGCISVSRIAAFPKVGETLDEEGVPVEDPENFGKFLATTLNQLEWLAEAMKTQRAIGLPETGLPQ
eukprot:TRINITY_DN238_c0_g1_i2.p1 TRINITY_DN238_c0_g1~~TRINITY_DN238_c0_g1_i2.p1  ORF type:complete len:229 (-),score=67.85 TRINITY_DN238_c0_g1_i2:86-733(-)